MLKTFLLVGLVFASSAWGYTAPIDSLTPGALCSAESRDFKKFDYPERIARCERHVNLQEKLEVAAAYGNIPREEWRNYEFDHLIPLCAGGANTADNLWPQPIEEAHDKDRLENEICSGLRSGRMLQEEAVRRVHEWFRERLEMRQVELE